jgi:sulfate adenylyltransferase
VPAHLIPPYGGTLIDLVVEPDRATELKKRSVDWPAWDLTARQMCDLELLASGGFSPLRGFLGEADYLSVCRTMRLADGVMWPIPVTLDVSDDVAAQLKPGSMLALRDPEGVMLAALEVEELWRPDHEAEAQAVFGTTDPAHPGVDRLLRQTHPWYVAGQLEVVEPKQHYDYRSLRLTPAALRARFAEEGWNRVVAFQTRNPMHRVHLELTLRAVKEIQANLLIHPVVGLTKPRDIDHYTRVRCYQAIMPSYPPGTAMLALLPLAMRMAGPREALWHGIIRRNHGATHFIVGRDHAGPGKDPSGKAFYGPYDAQDLMRRYQDEIGVRMVAFPHMVFLQDEDRYVPEDQAPSNARVLSISGTEQRRRLLEGRELPSWFTPPPVAAELRRSYPPRSQRGFAVFFTGLSGSGKSTIAQVLLAKLLEIGGRPVSMLDGDVVRRHLSNGLGFSKEDRDINIRRIGFVAAEIAKNGGIAICAPIAPYDQTRKDVRDMVEPTGGFILVYVATALDVCERRDRKGLYAKARAGLVQNFTGVSDPYEVPTDAEVVIDTTQMTAEEAAQRIILHLQAEGYIGGARD